MGEIEQRLVSLSQRHAELEAELHEELSRPQPDVLKLTEIKRQKLRVKEAMAATRQRALETI
jgi:hypothetical protein